MPVARGPTSASSRGCSWVASDPGPCYGQESGGREWGMWGRGGALRMLCHDGGHSLLAALPHSHLRPDRG